jgi:hypothetical protein
MFIPRVSGTLEFKQGHQNRTPEAREIARCREEKGQFGLMGWNTLKEAQRVGAL